MYGYNRIDVILEYDNINYNDMEWQEVTLPGRFDSLVSSNFDGVVWLRKDIFIENVDVDYDLHIGYIYNFLTVGMILSFPFMLAGLCLIFYALRKNG